MSETAIVSPGKTVEFGPDFHSVTLVSGGPAIAMDGPAGGPDKTVVLEEGKPSFGTARVHAVVSAKVEVHYAYDEDKPSQPKKKPKKKSKKPAAKKGK